MVKNIRIVAVDTLAIHGVDIQSKNNNGGYLD